MQVPKKPGLGIELDRAEVAKAHALYKDGGTDPAKLAEVRENGAVRNHRDWPARPFRPAAPADFA